MFSDSVQLTKSRLVVDPELNFEPEMSLSGTGTNFGTVIAYSPLVDGVNVYDIVLFEEKGQRTIEQNNSKLVLIDYEDILIVNHPPL